MLILKNHNRVIITLLQLYFNSNMNKFEEQKFNIPALIGISAKNIEEHLKLYAGYVKHTNLILEKIPDYEAWAQKDPFVSYYVAELQRRFSFEFGGMRNHEFYFKSFEGGATAIDQNGSLAKAITEEWRSFDTWLIRFKAIAMTRGVGWAKLVYDPTAKRLLNNWNDEQHIGQLPDTYTILALDMWEHAFVADYQPSGKKQYVEDFFSNLNWNVIEENYKKASS